MEMICETNNLVTALRRVKSNRGSPGADGMTVRDLEDHFRQHRPTITHVFQTLGLVTLLPAAPAA